MVKSSLANLKSFFVNREQSSFEESLGSTANNLSYFASTTGTDLNYLAIANGTSSQAESGGDAITTPAITDDYFGNEYQEAIQHQLNCVEHFLANFYPISANDYVDLQKKYIKAIKDNNAAIISKSNQ